MTKDSYTYIPANEAVNTDDECQNTIRKKQVNSIIGGIHKLLNHIYLIQINVKFQNITYIWTSAYELFTWLYIVGGLKREEKTQE